MWSLSVGMVGNNLYFQTDHIVVKLVVSSTHCRWAHKCTAVWFDGVGTLEYSIFHGELIRDMIHHELSIRSSCGSWFASVKNQQIRIISMEWGSNLG